MRMKKAFLTIACVFLALIIAAGCAVKGGNPDINSNSQNNTTASTGNSQSNTSANIAASQSNRSDSSRPDSRSDSRSGNNKNGGASSGVPLAVDLDDEIVKGRKVTVPDSYKAVYNAIAEHTQQFSYEMGISETQSMFDAAEMPVATSAPMMPEMDMPQENVAASDDVAGKGGGYSETNVQVAGVDEGDIVKTDGEYIYVLRPYINERSEIIIFKADGENTSRVSTVTVCKTTSDSKLYGSYNDKADYSYFFESASELYISGDTLAVLTNYDSYSEWKQGGSYQYENLQTQKVYIYDITNRSAPVLKATLGQDGYGITSRLIGDTLYLISNYYVYDIDESRPETYIPRTYSEDSAKLIAPDCIMIYPGFISTAYTVVCSYDLTDACLVDTKTTLGGGSTVYMNGSSLYVAGSSSVQTESEPRKESVYTVVERKTQEITDITKYEISEGLITVAATGVIPGYLNNQFSLDEHSEHLRAVTSTYSYNWTEYTDEQFGWTNYVYGDSARHNALFVLDSSLNIVGSIENLAENETVQSVRFFGDVGYFVTFERIDPLFAVDLSIPSGPVILSELKITGFSQYMHGFSDGRLFGLGMDADPKTGFTTTMKLSMFDTSDLLNVTEKHKLVLDNYYSNALYNHKAILISAEKDIIAFPTDNGYDFYGYSDANGFYKRASVRGLDWYGDSRGLYIDEYIYVIASNRISILELDSFSIVRNLAY